MIWSIMNRLLFLVVLVSVVGCASSSEYGLQPSPLVKEIEGKSSGSALEREIRQENVRAIETREEPIFRSDAVSSQD